MPDICESCTLREYSQPVPKSTFRADLQGLRVLAFLSIAIWHLSDTSLLVGAITVFFVLTTYFQAKKIRRIQSEKSTLHLPAEVARVIWRLFAHIHLVIILVAIWVLYRGPISVKELWLDSAFYMSFGLGNWFQIDLAQDYWNRDAELSPFFHLWAMSAQVQIIIILLTIGFALSLVKVKYPTIVKRIAWIILCVAAIVLLVNDVLNYQQDTETHLSTWTWLWAFCFGVLFAYTDFRLPENLITKTVTDLVFFAVIAIGVVGLFDVSIFGVHTKNVMLLLVMIPMFTNFQASATSALLRSQIFQKLSNTAFGVYLWHWPVMQMVKNELSIDTFEIYHMFTVLIVSFFISVISTFIIEKLTDYLEQLSAWIQWSLKVVLLSLVPIALYLAWTMNIAEPGPDIPEYELKPALSQAQADRPTFYDDPLCDQERDYSCQVGNPDSDIHLVLFGSSLAGNWEPAIKKVARERNWKFDIRIRLGCPDSDVDKDLDIGCEGWLSRTSQEILELKPDVVLVNLTSIGSDGTNETLSTDYKRWKVFLDNGISVVALRGSTQYPGRPLDCIEENADPIAGCLFIQKSRYTEIDVLTKKLKNYGENFTVVDMTSSFCERNVCLAVTREGIIVYRDPFHTTRTFSKSLAKDLKTQLDLFITKGQFE